MLGQLAWRGFSFAFGLVNLVALVGIAALRDRAFMKRVSEEAKKEFAAAQKRYWSIERDPLPGFTHQFFTTRNGVKLHYVANSNERASSSQNVAVFIHGFPDSFLLWRQLLKAPGLQNHILIAVDLPGYGGSDGLSKYGPEEVLEAMTGFILGMREKYLREDDSGKVIVVTHDWGTIVGARLAAEAKELADRWIITSAVIPQLWRSNATTAYASAKQMLHTWFRSPYRLRLLKNAFSTFSPIFSQISRSFYVFVFLLPQPLNTFAATFGNYWLLRVMHNVAAGLRNKDGKFARKLNASESADWMAMSAGPGLGQIEESKGAYAEAVRKRVNDNGMSEKIRIYRESLLLGPWEKSLETVISLSSIPSSASRSSSGAGLFEDGPPGALKVPATIVYGKEDPAFEAKLALTGISDFLVKGSQVLTIENAGHWIPFEGLGAKVLEDCVEWALKEDRQRLKTRFDGLPDVKFIVDK